MTTAYTYSKTLSDVAQRGTTGGGNENVGAQNPRNYKAEYGPVGWDRAHVFSASYIWQLPVLAHLSPFVTAAFGGWQFSGQTFFQSGLAFSPGNGVFAGLASHPNLVGPVAGPKTVQRWFNTAAFAPTTFGFFGNAGNGVIRGPGENTWNWALSKSFRFKEKADVQFRSEFFNIWNHPNFLGLATTMGPPNFGQITSALDPRILEFGLRVNY